MTFRSHFGSRPCCISSQTLLTGVFLCVCTIAGVGGGGWGEEGRWLVGEVGGVGGGGRN